MLQGMYQSKEKNGFISDSWTRGSGENAEAMLVDLLKEE